MNSLRIGLFATAFVASLNATNAKTEVVDSTCLQKTGAVEVATEKPRFTIGGYGEAVITRNFYQYSVKF